MSEMRREISSRRDWKLSVQPKLKGPLSDGIVTVRLPIRNDSKILEKYGENKTDLEGLWVGWPDADLEIKTWAKNSVDEWLKGWTHQGSDLGPALIVDGNNPFIAIVHLVPLSTDRLELLYGVLPSARQNHVASRAVKLVADWLLSDGRYSCLELRIGEQNLASQHVAENAGFKFVEKFETFVTGTGQAHVDFLYAKNKHP